MAELFDPPLDNPPPTGVVCLECRNTGHFRWIESHEGDRDAQCGLCGSLDVVEVSEAMSRLDGTITDLYDEIATLKAQLSAKGSPEVHPAWTSVIRERIRQVEFEGHTPQDDVKWNKGEQLVAAAVCYLAYPNSTVAPHYWPWRKESWKPKESRMRQLKISAALVLAEMERLWDSPSPAPMKSYQCHNQENYRCHYLMAVTDPACTGCSHRTE